MVRTVWNFERQLTKFLKRYALGRPGKTIHHNSLPESSLTNTRNMLVGTTNCRCFDMGLLMLLILSRPHADNARWNEHSLKAFTPFAMDVIIKSGGGGGCGGRFCRGAIEVVETRWQENLNTLFLIGRRCRHLEVTVSNSFVVNIKLLCCPLCPLISISLLFL